MKPVALRPRPSQPGAFEATTPYSSIFARRKGDQHGDAEQRAAHDGGALPLRGSQAALGPRPGGGGAWTPPPPPPLQQKQLHHRTP